MKHAILAAVDTGDQRIELREFPPPVIPPDGALLRVEAAGMCGADIAAFRAGTLSDCIMGHENVGTIEEIGEVAERRWGVSHGDRVVLEEYLPCWHCAWCRMGEYRLCFSTDKGQNPDALRFGNMKVSVQPALWGGYSQFLYLPGRSVLHRIADHVPGHHAAVTLPLANGIQWTLIESGVGIGSTVLIMGPGQQGLGCVIAAAEAGAASIIVTGTARDGHRLAAATRLGAHHVVDVDDGDVEEQVRELTGGVGPDVVIDATSATTPEVAYAGLRMLKRKGGTFVMQGLNTPVVDAFPMGMIASKYVTMKVARGHSSRAVSMAIGMIESGRHDLSRIATHEVGLDRLAEGLQLSSTDPTAIHVTVDPWQ